MTTDFDRRCLIEFNAAAYILYERGRIMTTTTQNTIDREKVVYKGNVYPAGSVGYAMAARQIMNEAPCHEAPDEPTLCLTCGQPVPQESDGFLRLRCETCAASLPTIDDASTDIYPDDMTPCQSCGEPIPEEGEFCPDCIAASQPEDDTRYAQLTTTDTGPLAKKWNDPEWVAITQADWDDEHIFCTCDACRNAPADPEILATVTRVMKQHGIMVLLALLVALTTHTASAARYHDYPIIGTAAYNASCTITRDFEDHSALAYCTEDGATYAFDPDGNGMAGISYNPGWQWHAVEEVT